MSDEYIAAIEYETLVFSRHQSQLAARPRRSAGTLDHSAYILLSILQVDGPSSIGELRKATGHDASTLNRQTAAITRDGYAERIADPQGGIARKFRITATGLEALAEERAASRQIVAEILQGWDPAEREAFAAFLYKFNEGIEQRSGNKWPRPTSEQIEAAARNRRPDC